MPILASFGAFRDRLQQAAECGNPKSPPGVPCECVVGRGRREMCVCRGPRPVTPTRTTIHSGPPKTAAKAARVELDDVDRQGRVPGEAPVLRREVAKLGLEEEVDSDQVEGRAGTPLHR